MTASTPRTRLVAASALIALSSCSSKTIVLDPSSDARRWSDGSFAKSCDEYRKPAGGYAYTGDVGTGAYTISPTGTAFRAWCDMEFDGGGWTLVNAVVLDEPGPEPESWSTTPGFPEPGKTQAWLDVAYVKALALPEGTRVHIRTNGKLDTHWITSKPDSEPVKNLRLGHSLNWGDVEDDKFTDALVAASWDESPMYDHMRWSCDWLNEWPMVYGACGNGQGLMWTDKTPNHNALSAWAWDTRATPEPLELYVGGIAVAVPAPNAGSESTADAGGGGECIALKEVGCTVTRTYDQGDPPQSNCCSASCFGASTEAPGLCCAYIGQPCTTVAECCPSPYPTDPFQPALVAECQGFCGFRAVECVQPGQACVSGVLPNQDGACCNGGQCAVNGVPVTTVGAPGTCCGGFGARCTSNDDCCSRACTGGAQAVCNVP